MLGGGEEVGEEQVLGGPAKPREGGLRTSWVREQTWHKSWLDSRGWVPHPVPGTHMLRFCLAFSMSLLISGVMLNRSFLGMGKGTMGDRVSSAFFLQIHGLGLTSVPGEPGSIPRRKARRMGP